MKVVVRMSQSSLARAYVVFSGRLVDDPSRMQIVVMMKLG